MTISQYYEYSFIALICLGLLMQNYRNVRNYGHRTSSGRFLRLFILSLTGCCILEVSYGLRESGLLWQNEAFGYIEEILYSIVTMLAAYFWFIASEFLQQSKSVATFKRQVIISIPLLIMIVLTALTPLHHLSFYFENGHYVRGKLTLVVTLVLSAFIIWTGVSALVKSFSRKFYMERGYFRIVFLYAVVLLAFQGLQTVVGSVLPFRTIGATLVTYIVQQKFIKDNIYTDSLTGANNRNLAERFIRNHMENKQESLQVAMIDIDKFKMINDTFGHQTGDKAIQLMAKAFMSSLEHGTFFARYGGDEFLLIDISDDLERIERIVQNARQSLNEMCISEKIGCTFDFSCGIIQRTPEMVTIPDVLEAADAAMYKVKREKKAARQ